MAASRVALFSLVALCILTIEIAGGIIDRKASSLKCESCAPFKTPCDGSNVTSVECGGLEDRCFTATVNAPMKIMEVKGCANSKLNCQEDSQYNLCSSALYPCNITCCEGDMCNQDQPPPPLLNFTIDEYSKPDIAASSLKCESCAPFKTPCDGSNVTSVECGGLEDRCFTATVQTPTKIIEVKGCTNSKLNCQEDSQYNLCSSALFPCNVTCCEGDMCNQAQPLPPLLSVAVDKSFEIGIGGPLFRCQTCGPFGEPCSPAANVDTTSECGGIADRCMTISVTVGSETVVMKNCGNSKLNCQENGQYNPCNMTVALGGSCNVTCCEGDMCNEDSPGEVNTTTVNPFKPEVEAVGIKCPVCMNLTGYPGAKKCDEAELVTCKPASVMDRCMSVDAVMFSSSIPFQLKNCSNSFVCDPDNNNNVCNLLNRTGFVRSCSFTCTVPSSHPTDAPSTTVSPPTPRGTKPPPAVVKGRFFKVNSSPVCFGSKNNEFGNFSVPTTGDLAAIKLVHLYGYVACYSTAKWSLWGCGGPRVNVVITTSANDVILPPAEFSNSGHWATIPGYTSLSPELVLSVFSRPRSVTSGEELRLWYGEDFVDAREGDNRGRVCSDVFALFY